MSVKLRREAGVGSVLASLEPQLERLAARLDGQVERAAAVTIP